MLRITGIICAAALLAITGTAVAQLPGALPSSADPDISCPHGRLSIYYASGEAASSPQAEALIDLISEHAARCNAEGLDLIARIDSRVDGDKALALALERLSSVAGDLVAKGIPVDRIRVAAQAAQNPPSASLTQIDVIFRKADPTPEVAAPAPSQPRTFANDTI